MDRQRERVREREREHARERDRETGRQRKNKRSTIIHQGTRCMYFAQFLLNTVLPEQLYARPRHSRPTQVSCQVLPVAVQPNVNVDSSRLTQPFLGGTTVGHPMTATGGSGGDNPASWPIRELTMHIPNVV